MSYSTVVPCLNNSAILDAVDVNFSFNRDQQTGSERAFLHPTFRKKQALKGIKRANKRSVSPFLLNTADAMTNEVYFQSQ